jgi:hypothetical protein
MRAWEQMETQADLLIRCDADDPAVQDYLQVFRDVSPQVPGAIFSVGPRLRLGPTLNAEAVRYAPAYDAIGFLGDDHCPRTPQWDEMLAASITDGGIAYGDDLLQGAALATALLMSSDIIEATGQFCPRNQTHLYLDNYWMDLGQALGKLHFVPGVILEHLHPGNGKAESDAGYFEVNVLDPADRLAYSEYKETQFADDVLKVLAAWQ